MELGRANGFADEIEWLGEILSWPIEWSCLHGIAEIHTPILKFITNTDATSTKYVVQLMGSAFPSKGGSGIRFPYQSSKRISPGNRGQSAVRESSATRGSSSRVADEANENGFSNKDAMDAAHAPLLSLLRSHFRNSIPQGYALDLGCGTGALLAKIRASFPELIPIGIEINVERAGAARRKLRVLGGEAFVGNMFSSQEIWLPDRMYHLSIISVTRFLEVEPRRSSHLRKLLLEHSTNLAVYIYGDGASRYNKDLIHLLGDAGFEESGWRVAETAAVCINQRRNRS
jgi:hypothetical protein